MCRQLEVLELLPLRAEHEINLHLTWTGNDCNCRVIILKVLPTVVPLHAPWAAKTTPDQLACMLEIQDGKTESCRRPWRRGWGEITDPTATISRSVPFLSSCFFSCTIRSAEQSVRAICLSDGPCSRLYLLSRKISHSRGPTSANGAWHGTHTHTHTHTARHWSAADCRPRCVAALTWCVVQC